jgi:hypothetical protein
MNANLRVFFLFHDLRPDDVTLGFGEGREEPGGNNECLHRMHVQLLESAAFTAPRWNKKDEKIRDVKERIANPSF